MDLNETIERMKALKCPQCGSTNIDMETMKSGKCKNCGATVLIEDTSQTVVNNVNVVVGDTQAVSFYEVKADVTFLQFEKMVYKDLSYKDTTPPDVLSADFKKPKAKNVHVIEYTGDASINYSCSVGTDVERTRYNAQGTATKYKETEWQPYRGSYSDRKTVYVQCGDEDADTIMASMCIDNAKTVAEGEAFDISERDTQNAKGDILEEAAHDCKRKIRADHVKDFTYTGVAEIVSVKGYTLPQYYMDYEYKNKTYRAYAYAAGQATALRPGGYGGTYGYAPDCSKEVKNTADKRNLPFSLLSAILLIASIIISFVIKDKRVIVTCFAIAAASFIIQFISQAIFKKAIFHSNAKEKKKRLAKLLNSKGLN